jgi:hypothetical protein
MMMTIPQIAVFTIRLLALGLAVAGASSLLALTQLLGNILAGGDSMSQSVWVLASMILLLQYTVYGLLWLYAGKIAKGLIPASVQAEQIPVASSISLYQWQVLGVVLIGLWTLVHAIPDAGYWLGFIYYLNAQGDIGWASNIAPEYKAQMLATGISLFLGVLLLFNASKLVLVLFYRQKVVQQTKADN